MKLNSKFIRVPYGLSVHGENEIKAVNNVLKNSTQMGKKVQIFEKKISRLFDKKYGVMTNSGSSALLLAIEALNLPKESEVITPALTFSTTVSSIIKNNLIPVFIDIKLNTLCIDETKIEKKISKKTKAILCPDLIGNICDWKYINKIAKKYNLIIIHDSADALGSKLGNKNVGFYSDISITSFYGSHIINGAGNGGMVCLSNKKLSSKIKLLRSWGRSSSLYLDHENIENRFNIKLDKINYDRKFVFEEIGYQLEPSEISAAFGIVQLSKLKNNIDKRINVFKKHYNFFLKFNNFFIQPLQNPISKTGWLAYPLIIKENKFFNRSQLQIFLEKRNIQTRVIFTGNILRQPGFKKIKCKGKAKDFQNADYVMKNGILIGCHHGLNNYQIKHIHKSIEKFIISKIN
tara:strand:+ start:241 stop:1455 length:1215 start_codon:yes stop_codon:yes gene_type:complete